MRILLTNDDGIYAPGLAAIEQQLSQVGDVTVVAPATEQSGVGHSITFLSPLIAQEIYDHKRFRGWAVEGSPADCVKIAVYEFCDPPPDLIVSGINGGLNAGINVLYSGTVAAAIEGAFFGITSVAVSLEYDEQADFDRAAQIAQETIAQIVEKNGLNGQLYNLNIPTSAMETPRGIRVVPMGVSRYGEHFVKRQDPKGRNYFWATNDPPPKPEEEETDLSALAKGWITLTPLSYNMTDHATFAQMKNWELNLQLK